MAKHILNDKQCMGARPAAKPVFLIDGEGLRMRVAPSGVKSWQLKVGDSTASLGRYPVPVSLSKARELADKARILAFDGVTHADAKRQKRAERAAGKKNSFGAVAAAWLAKQNLAPRYLLKVEQALRNHLSSLSAIPVTDISALRVSPILEAVERSAPNMARKVRSWVNGILWHAVSKGLDATPLPAMPRRKSTKRSRHYAAVIDLTAIGQILRAARAANVDKGVARAHVLLAFCAQRSGEVVGARWDEFDLEAGDWVIPRDRMKLKDPDRGPHIVPLAPMLLATLREWRVIDGPDATHVCPSPVRARRCITGAAVANFYLKKLGLKGRHVPHSWRATFSTVCREKGKDADVVESQLDHIVGDAVAAAYDRARRVELRRELMAWYESMLISARDGATVTKLAKRS